MHNRLLIVLSFAILFGLFDRAMADDAKTDASKSAGRNNG